MKKLFLLLCLSLFTASGALAADPAPVKLRTVSFKDKDMGDVTSHTMLVPEGWKAEGETRWAGSPVPIAEPKITLEGEDGSKIAIMTTVHFGYSESNWGPPEGMKPPENFGKWVVSLAEKNKNYKKVKLVDDTRDEAAEKELFKLVPGLFVKGSAHEYHDVIFTYENNGVKFTEHIKALYSRQPVIRADAFTFANWMVCVQFGVRAPSKTFEEQKPMLYACAKSLRPVPKWYTQMMELRTELIRLEGRRSIEAIQARAKHYEDLSEQNMKAWKKSQASSDAKHNDFINTIYEVSDFKDRDGLTVKLPHHYKNYYTDGQGNYLLTNTQDQPRGDWTVIRPVR